MLADRAEYIKLMDALALRMPLWLHFTQAEFEPLRARLPPEGPLVHSYVDPEKGAMVEVHVDLDDAFDARRADMPYGGGWSVRGFPEGPPVDRLRPPPANLPDPGVDLSSPEPFEANGASTAEPPAAAAAAATATASPPLLTDAAIRKLKVAELKAELQKLDQPIIGLKAALCDRLLEAVREAREAAAGARGGESNGGGEGGDADGEGSEGECEGEDGAGEWKIKKVLGRRERNVFVDALLVPVVEYQVQWDYPVDGDFDEETGTRSGEYHPGGEDEVTWEKETDLANSYEALHEFLATQPKAPGCKFGHLAGVCRCSCPLIHSGQDESIFKAFQKSSYQWVVKGVRGLRKKTDGPGEMISGFKDEIRGFGCPLSPDELLRVNAFRKARGKAALKGSPAVRFLTYGKNKDGYWTFAHFAEQTADILDMYEALYPEAQILVEVDWSSGHSKHREDALNVLAMAVNFGGKQPVPHASEMIDGCLGEDSPTLKLGDLQYFYFRSAEVCTSAAAPAPASASAAASASASASASVFTLALTLTQARADNGATDGKPDPPPFYKPDLSPTEYIGKAKGKKQILWERGLYKPGMVEKVDEDDSKGRDVSLSMDHVLGRCTDFRNETPALQAMVEARGHILAMSPKGHCELAGNGIEYDWGKMKQNFRRKNRYGNFHQLILDSMSRKVLPVSTSRKFARKARAYRRAYREGTDNEHASIEAMVKKFKAHRNAADFASKFIRDA